MSKHSLHPELLSKEPVAGTQFTSNISQFKGSVFGGNIFGVFNNFREITNWFYEYTPETGTLTVWKEEDPSDSHIVFSGIRGITELCFTFDKTMLYVASYIRSKKPYIWYWDSLEGEYRERDLPASTENPKVALNSLSPLHTEESDVILGYVRDSRYLCIRRQQDRYGKEFIVKEFPKKVKLYSIGFNDKNRFQYEVLESL